MAEFKAASDASQKLLPHDVDAEEAVIGSLLVDGEACDRIATFLSPQDFYRERNRWIHDACLSLYNRNEVINQITVAHELAQRDELEAIGGSAYLSHLISIVPTSVYIEHCAHIVHRMAIRRRVIEVGAQIERLGYDETDPEEMLAEAEGLLGGLRSRLEPQGTLLRQMCLVEPQTVDWLWRPYIPKGKLTLLEGDPGAGKSWLSLAIATAVTLGQGLPGQETTEPANVLLASAEDGLGDTIRPRLDAMGTDVRRVFAIDGAVTFDERGFAELERYLEQTHPALLIIDPLVAYLGAGVDIHRANETRAVLAQLARLAEKFDTAISAVRHLTKGGMSKAIYRGLGSIEFTAACRSVLLAGCDPENPQSRALVHIKSNLAPVGPSIGYELRDGGFYWTGESSLTAAQILAADNGGGTPVEKASAFLKGELADTEVPAKDIYQAAQDMGIAERTLERAKANLQAKSRKRGDTWFWYLPEPTSPTPPTERFGDLDHFVPKKKVVAEGLGDLDPDNAWLIEPEGPTAWKESVE